MNNLPTRTIGAVVQSSNSSTDSCTIPKRTFYPINTLLWWVKIPFLSTWTTYEEIQSLPDLQVGVTKAELIEKTCSITHNSKWHYVLSVSDTSALFKLVLIKSRKFQSA